MTWRLAVVVILTVVASGCRTPDVGIDPFGRTTIPPPATGAVSRSGTGDPYYSGVRSGGAPSLVPLDRGISNKVSATSALPVSSSTRGWNSTGNSASAADIPGRLRPVPTDLGDLTRATNVSLTGGTPAAWEKHPASPAAYRENITGRASPATVRPQIHRVQYSHVDNADRTDIATLPQTDGKTRGQITTSRLGNHTVDTTAGRYGHASDYTWLKGRLEYIASQRQWKLRYISLNQETDTFGGSVILSDLTELENYRTGDFVLVRGRLADIPSDSRTVSPVFSVTRLNRQN
ncbi:MAG: hypothetical protein VX988_00970 [Planctomycetota bacterium]|nr:hypothetical protein [Planctomycetota bacterium]